MLSNKCKYGVRAILFLATQSSPERKYGGKRIAEALKIPSPFLGKILQDLVRKNLVSSVKGPNGGFFLTNENLNATLMEVIEAIDGLSFFTTCAVGLENCSDLHPCPIHQEFKESRQLLEKLFNEKTIRQLSAEVLNSDIYLVL